MAKKIFIIEDDANILYGLQAKFRVNGFETDINNGSFEISEVINQIIKFKPDFLIQDLMLPKIDGFEMIKELQQNDNTKNIPIFIFTNLSDEDSKSRGLNYGVKYFFVKSDFNIDDFVEKVSRIIKNLNKTGIAGQKRE
jgi:two-component system, OmpR family, alkaline phosphatase synthesis response regulator PhoP